MLTDEDWERSHRDDVARFECLYERYTARLRRYAWFWLRDSDDAEDAVQEVWTRAFLHRHETRSQNAVHAWLLSICRAVCVDQLRARNRQRSLMSMNRAALLDTLPLQTGEPDPTSTLLVLMETIAYSIAELPARQRLVFDLRLLQLRSVAETAIELGIAEGTVKATLHQARGNMRRMIHAAAIVTEDGDICVLGGGKRTISILGLTLVPDSCRGRRCVMKRRLHQALTHALPGQRARGSGRTLFRCAQSRSACAD